MQRRYPSRQIFIPDLFKRSRGLLKYSGINTLGSITRFLCINGNKLIIWPIKCVECLFYLFVIVILFIQGQNHSLQRKKTGSAYLSFVSLDMLCQLISSDTSRRFLPEKKKNLLMSFKSKVQHLSSNLTSRLSRG